MVSLWQLMTFFLFLCASMCLAAGIKTRFGTEVTR